MVDNQNLSHDCPVSGLKDAFGEPCGYEICPKFNWEDDPVQYEDYGYAGGANFFH